MASENSVALRDVYIVDGARTPFLKARGTLGPFSGSDLAVSCARELLLRQPFAPTDLSEVIVGCMMPSADEANIARIIALRLGCGNQVPGWTVQRNCASGLQALDNAYQNIAMGRSELILAGGTDAMSRAPILFNEKMANWLGSFMNARQVMKKIATALQFRPSFLAPVIALLRGLTDPIVGLSMGQTAENLAYRFNISRREMDEFAVRSHQRLTSAQEKGFYGEISPLFDTRGNCYLEDDGIRKDSSVEKLAQLKPFFDKKYGAVTPGNSSQVTDGAAMLILASADAVKKYHLPVRARIRASQFSALDPAQMGLGPVHAINDLLRDQQLQVSDIDYWEINEAFAAQVLACVKAMADKQYCQDELHLAQAIGELDMAHVNVDGGAIGVGHPIGASGARIVLHLMNVLEHHHAKRGIATLCVGGGQGGAMLIEAVSKAGE